MDDVITRHVTFLAKILIYSRFPFQHVRYAAYRSLDAQLARGKIGIGQHLQRRRGGISNGHQKAMTSQSRVKLFRTCQLAMQLVEQQPL